MSPAGSRYENVGIFLSHAHKDKDFAKRLGNDLISRGIRVWIDSAELDVGDSLLGKIGDGLQTMDYLGVILSPTSVNSEWVRREVEIAVNKEIDGRKVAVLPILLESCEIPPFLVTKLYADFRDPSVYLEALEMLLRRFRKTSPLQGVLRAALPAFTLHGALLDYSTLSALAYEKVLIDPLESDFVFESLKPVVLSKIYEVWKWHDENDECADWIPDDVWNASPSPPTMRGVAAMLSWAHSYGWGERVFGVYAAIRERYTISHAEAIQELIGEGAPKEPTDSPR